MKFKSEQVAVILLNWQGASDTISCIDSLLESGLDLQNIFVVDNNSQDDSVSRLLRAFPGLRLLLNSKNGGFSHGCNLGIQHALKEDYSYVWLLNNDTIVNSDTLPAMLREFQTPDVGIVGSVIRHMDFPFDLQTIGGGVVNYTTCTTRNIVDADDLKNLTYITGASMLISRAVFDKIGLLNERYFMYWEDVEFSVKARAAGFRLEVALDSVVLHKEAASAGMSHGKLRMVSRSLRTFFRGNHPRWYVPVTVYMGGKTVKMLTQRDIKGLPYLWF